MSDSNDEASSMASLIALMNANKEAGVPFNEGQTISDSAPAFVPATELPAFGWERDTHSFKPGSVDPYTGEIIEFDGPPAEMFGSSPMGHDYAPSHDMGRAPVYRPDVGSDEKSDMRKLMSIFRENGGDEMVRSIERGVGSVAGHIAEDAEAMPELRRALYTSRTRDGVRVGAWQITVMEEGAKRYDVSHVDTGDVLAKELYLYEAAEALVKHLNDGLPINNQKIQRILQLEMDYSRNLDDAITFKRTCSRALDRGDDLKLNVAKARFSESRASAMKAKKALMEFLAR